MRPGILRSPIIPGASAYYEPPARNRDPGTTLAPAIANRLTVSGTLPEYPTLYGRGPTACRKIRGEDGAGAA